MPCTASRGRKRIRVINGTRVARGGISVSYLSTRVKLPLLPPLIVLSPLSLSLLSLSNRHHKPQINLSFASKVETRQKLSPFPTFLSLNFNRPSFDRSRAKTSR